jgi:hypothetical protein
MNRSLIRQIIRQELAESSRSRRANTRAALSAADAPDVPVKKSGRQDTEKQIARFGLDLARRSAGDRVKYGFTMTSIQKVGINPASPFDTPLALYAYPVTPEMIMHLTRGRYMQMGLEMPEIADQLSPYASIAYQLPFVADAPYINFFGFNDMSGVFQTSTGMDDAAYRAAIDKLLEWFKQNSREANPERSFMSMLVQAGRHHNVFGVNDTSPKSSSSISDLGRLKIIWTLSRALSNTKVAADFDTASETGSRVKSSDISVWRRLLIMAGIKALVDDAGEGLVHKNEPQQIAIMDTSIIDEMRQFNNVFQKPSKPPTYDKQRLESKINDIIDDIRINIRKFKKGTDKMMAAFDLIDVAGRDYRVFGSKLKGTIDRLRLRDEISEIVSWFVSNYDRIADILPIKIVIAYELSGGESIIDALVSRSGGKFGWMEDFLKRLWVAVSDPSAARFAIKLCEKFFDSVKGSIASQDIEAASFLVMLSGSDFLRKSVPLERFTQLVVPVIRELGSDYTLNDPEHGEGRLIDILRLRYTIKKRRAEEDIETGRLRIIDKKNLFRPNVKDLKARLGGVEDLFERLQDIVSGAMSEIGGYKIKIGNDPQDFKDNDGYLRFHYENLFRNDFVPGWMTSVPAEQRQQMEEINKKYKKAIHAAAEDGLSELYDKLGEIKTSVPNVVDRLRESKRIKYELAKSQIMKISAAVSEFQTEMTAYLTSIDGGSVEQTQLYESLLVRLLKMK